MSAGRLLDKSDYLLTLELERTVWDVSGRLLDKSDYLLTLELKRGVWDVSGRLFDKSDYLLTLELKQGVWDVSWKIVWQKWLLTDFGIKEGCLGFQLEDCLTKVIILMWFLLRIKVWHVYYISDVCFLVSYPLIFLPLFSLFFSFFFSLKIPFACKYNYNENPLCH